MYDRLTVLHLVSDAERETPWCASCGAVMIPVDHDGGLWLECSDRLNRDDRKREGLLGRVASLEEWLFPHSRQVIISAEELAAA
jgi:hypothetical protein